MVDEALRVRILNKIRYDPIAVDFQWSLFSAAISSYKHDSVLRPFPLMYVKEQNGLQDKDYQALKKVSDTIPNIKVILDQDARQLDRDQLELLNWLINTDSFSISTCNKNMYEEIQSLTGQSDPIPGPNYIFEVTYNESRQRKFEQLQESHDVLYAYHGSRTENFHSILHHGLHSHMNKNSLFGEGTYLSSELSVSLPYSPSGQAWEGSGLGTSLSCVLVCQIIDHPSVKCQTKDKDAKSRAKVKGSMAGDVPEKYYIVQNNELVRIKYVLVYATRPIQKVSAHHPSRPSWISEHKFILSMAFYVILLIAVGLSNSKSFRYYIKRMWKYSLTTES